MEFRAVVAVGRVTKAGERGVPPAVTLSDDRFTVARRRTTGLDTRGGSG
jgi:hypothetical protein